MQVDALTSFARSNLNHHTELTSTQFDRKFMFREPPQENREDNESDCFLALHAVKEQTTH